MNRFSNLKTISGSKIEYEDLDMGCIARADLNLLLTRLAWENGCNFEDLADGFGPGLGTLGGDWSGIRDSSDEAKQKMLERALNYFDQALRVYTSFQVTKQEERQ